MIQQKPFAIILVDIDFFKKINDSFGHVAGDDCLITVADKIKSCIKPFVSSVSRYGGDEFIIIINDASSTIVEIVCMHIKKSINENTLKSIGDKCVSVTQGAAICHNAKYVNDIINCADKALYEAKENGRNCYRIAE